MDTNFTNFEFLSIIRRKGYCTSSEQLTVVDPLWETLDPNPDIQALCNEFNQKFFWGRMPQLEVKWSNRLTVTLGITKFDPDTGKCKIELSKRLLELLPRKDTVETLLHEMIHAYISIMDLDDDDDDHGVRFYYYKRYIDRLSGTNIKLEHPFHDEVDSLKRHRWLCDGPCGQIKMRATNREPDTKVHKRKCGGNFVKIAEPEKPPKKRKRMVEKKCDKPPNKRKRN